MQEQVYGSLHGHQVGLEPEVLLLPGLDQHSTHPDQAAPPEA